jgi:hypothetical protein
LSGEVETWHRTGVIFARVAGRGRAHAGDEYVLAAGVVTSGCLDRDTVDQVVTLTQ